jgi:NAD dependent epimerase/dehydratase family enzyme
MNILVLGGTRFMGKHLVSTLLRKGHKITIATRDISEYVCKKRKALLFSESGELAPYNGEAPYTINTELAYSVGFSFTPLHQWIWTLIDHYLKELNV